MSDDVSIPRSPDSVPSQPDGEREQTRDDDESVDEAAAEFSALLGHPKKKDKSGASGNLGSLLPGRGSRSADKENKAPSSGHGLLGSGTLDPEHDGLLHDGPTEGDPDLDSAKRRAAQHSGEQPHELPGDAILRSLASQAGTDISKTESHEDQPVDKSQALDRVANAVVSKVLVSDPAHGEREVRLVLKDDVLPQTEVRITQDAGKLQVQFVTGSTDAQNTLAQNQESLQQSLNEKLSGRDIVVSVAMESASQGDQQDGRSRQQRHIEDEWTPDKPHDR